MPVLGHRGRLMKHFIGILIAAAFIPFGLISTANADFQGDVLQESLTESQRPEIRIRGVQSLQKIEELDLTTPFTREEWDSLRSSFLEAFGQDPWMRETTERYFSMMDAGNEPPPPNTLAYIGVDLGYGLGLNANIAMIVGHDLVNRKVSVVPALVTRIQAFDLGTNFHLGMGVLAPGFASPHLTVGVMLAATAGIGIGVGKAIHDAFWVEYTYGSGLQAGPYVEFILSFW